METVKNKVFEFDKKNKEHKALLFDTIEKHFFPESFINKITENNVFTNFHIYTNKEDIQEIEFVCRKFGNIFPEIVHIGNYIKDTTKVGIQSFTLNSKKTEYKKDWGDRSIIRYIDRLNGLALENTIRSYMMGEVAIKHWARRFLPLKNNIKLKKIPYVLAQRELPFENFPKTIPYDVKKSNKQDLHKYIECKNSVFGYSQRPNDNQLWFDIDNDPDNKKYNKIMELCGNPIPFYGESSNWSGGKHVYIQYDKPIPDTVRKEIEDYCKENGVKVECCFTNNFLQLPCSVDYSPWYMPDYYKDGSIRLLNQLNPKDILYTIKSLIKRIDKKKLPVNSTDKLLSILNGTYSKFDDILTYEEDDNITPIIVETPIQVKPKKKSFDIIEKYPVIYKNKLDGSIKHGRRDFILAEAGNKRKALFNNVWTCLDKGITDFDEIRYYLTKYQGSSTTISNTSNSDIQKIIDYYYENQQKGVATKNIYSYISNKYILSSEIQSVIKRALPQFTKAFICNSKSLYPSKVRENDLQIIAEEMLYEMIGRFLYQIENPEEANLPSHLIHLFNQELLTGFSISIKVVELLINNLLNKELISHSFDARNIRDIFVKTFNLIPTFLYRNMKQCFYNINEEVFNCNYNIKGLPIQFKFNSTTKQELEKEIISNYLLPYINIESKVLSNIIHSLQTGEALDNKIQLEIKNNLFRKLDLLNMNYVESKNIEIYDFIKNLDINDPPNIT